MPTKTAEQVKKRAQTLRKKFAGAGDALSGEKRRAMRKQVKRAQRKRRRLDAEVKRNAPKPAAS